MDKPMPTASGKVFIDCYFATIAQNVQLSDYTERETDRESE